MAGSRQNGSGPRTEAKNERQLFLAGLFRKGVPQSQIYRVMVAKFGVTVQTVRKDIKSLGLAAQRIMDSTDVIQAETSAALDRLKQRAQRDDSVGNAADQLILNLLNQRQVQDSQISACRHQEELRGHQARIAGIRVQMANMELETLTGGTMWTKDATRRLSKVTRRIINNGSATMADMVEVLGVIIQRQLETPDEGTAQIMQSLRLLARISLEDPNAMAQDDQLFKVPDGMRVQALTADDGDELIGP